MNYWDDKSDYYVAPIYDTLKEEVLYSGLINIKQYKVTLKKAMDWVQTKYNRQRKARKFGREESKYDIIDKEPMDLTHLFAIILYTDFTDLSAAGSASCRYKNIFEPLQSL